MKKTLFTGAGVAIITPMHDDGSVHWEKLGQVIDFQVEHSTDAIIICGTTGESAVLSHEEHVKAIQMAVERTAGRIPVIAGTGSNDTKYALELSLEAQKLGVDGLLMVTPYYNKTSQSGLVAHYEYVADRVKTPMILYNVPSRTGVNIKPETYKALSAHPNIVAAKEANGDIGALARTISLCGDDLDIYSGNDDQIVPVLSLGGKGVISVLSNVAPQGVHDICALFFEGKVKESAALQLRYLQLINALFSDVNPIPVKEAMNLMNQEVGPCRLPLVPLSDSARAALKEALQKVNLL